MANNLIQIKRSLNTANPTSLANGELAFTANGDVLFIGSNSAVVAIGGKRNPGTLTANQALVANATSGIDKIIVANAAITSVWANGSSGSAGQLLSSNGSAIYWTTPDPSVAGSNSQVQFNANGALAGDSGFTFDGVTDTLSVGNVKVTGTTTSTNTSTGALTVAGGVGVAGRINTGDLAAGNDSVYSSLTGTTLTTNTVLAGATVNAATLSVGGWVVANQSGVFTSGVVNGDILQVGSSFKANTTQVIIGSSVGLSANGSLGSANQVLRTSGTTVYWSDDTGDISSVTAGDGLTGGGSSGDVTVDVGAGYGITVNTTAVAVNANNGLVANADGLFVKAGTGIVVNALGVHTSSDITLANAVISDTLTVYGNTVLGSNTQDLVTVNALLQGNLIPSANATYWVGNNTLRWNEGHFVNVHSVSGYFDGSVQISGNLVVTGNVYTTNVQSVVISDPLIYLAGNNYTSDLVDIGFVANYNDGTNRHTGLFRDATDSTYKLFYNLTQELDGVNTVNVADPTFAIATLNAYILSGGLTTNSTAVTITANSTYDVNLTANSLSLSTALPATSGGTGYNTYTSGDILVANTGNTLSKLTLGSSGYVLQSNGTALVYDTLDGGTF